MSTIFNPASEGPAPGVFDGNKVRDINDLKKALAPGIKAAVDRLQIERIQKLMNDANATKKELTDLLLDEFNKYFVLIK